MKLFYIYNSILIFYIIGVYWYSNWGKKDLSIHILV